MTAEVLALTPSPAEIGLTPQKSHPNHSNMPLYLIKATGQDGNVRGAYVEDRLKTLLASQPEIKKVVVHGKNTREDKRAHDLTVVFKSDSYLGRTLGKIHIQGKASRHGTIQFKHEERDKLPEKRRNMIEVHKKMTRRKIALINGSQTKSDREILEDSYLPQLRRMVIKAHELRVETPIFPQTFELMHLPVKNDLKVLEGGE